MKSLSKVIAGLGIMAAAIVSPINAEGDNYVVERGQPMELTYEVRDVSGGHESRVVNDNESEKALADMVSMRSVESWPNSTKVRIEVVEEKDRIDFSYSGLERCRENSSDFYLYVASPPDSIISGSQELIVRDNVQDRFVEGVTPEETDSYKFMDRLNDFLDDIISPRGDFESMMFDSKAVISKEGNPYTGVLDKIPGKVGTFLSIGKNATQLVLSGKEEADKNRIANLGIGYQVSRIMPSQIKEFNLRDTSNITGRRISLKIDPKSKDPIYIVAARLGFFKDNQLRSREGVSLDNLAFEFARGAKGDLSRSWGLDDLRGTYWILKSGGRYGTVVSFDKDSNLYIENILKRDRNEDFCKMSLGGQRRVKGGYSLNVESILVSKNGELNEYKDEASYLLFSRVSGDLCIKSIQNGEFYDFPGGMNRAKIFEKRKSVRGNLGFEFEESEPVQLMLDDLEDEWGYRPVISYEKLCSAKRGEGECLDNRQQLVGAIYNAIKFRRDPKDDFEHRAKNVYKCPSGGRYSANYPRKSAICDIHGRLNVSDLPKSWGFN
ncbi:hypothetical protein HN747_02360 [archaeon]|nr:hypothetical protein [archaeon]